MVEFSIDQLECFTTAAEAGSFSAAGRRLGKAQSAISTAVANLEIDLGVALFDRSGKYLELTLEGEVLLRDAESILFGCSRMENRALAFSGDVDTRIRIAVDKSLQNAFLLDIFKKFQKKFPATELEILVGVFSDVQRYLAEGSADMGLLIGTCIPDPVMKYKLLDYVPFQATVSIDHPMADKGKVTLSDLEDELQFVVTSRGEERGEEISVFSRRVWTLESYSTALQLVESNMGWAFFPVPLLKKAANEKHVTPLPLELEGRPHTSPLYLLWTREDMLGKAAKWLFNRFSPHVKHSKIS